MRIAVVIIGSLLLLLLIAMYLDLAARARPTRYLGEPIPAGQEVQIELTPTFEPRAAGWTEPQDVVLEVRSAGKLLVAETESVASLEARTYRVSLPGLTEVELWCAAYAGSDAALSDAAIEVEGLGDNSLRGLRVRVGRDGQWWNDQTLWAVPGGAPAGTIRVRLPEDLAAPAAASSQPVSVEAEELGS